MTKALFSVILNVSKERGTNQWNVLIVIESAERTLNALNVERENKNGNGILTMVCAVADNYRALSISFLLKF